MRRGQESLVITFCPCCRRRSLVGWRRTRPRVPSRKSSNEHQDDRPPPDAPADEHRGDHRPDEPSESLGCRVLATLSLALSVGLIAAPGAAAYSVQCDQSGIGCISQYGYTGQSVWGYPVDGGGNNCTNYAAFRLSRNGAVNPGIWATLATGRRMLAPRGSGSMGCRQSVDRPMEPRQRLHLRRWGP